MNQIRSESHIILCYNDFQTKGFSHRGLGINCLNTAKCLRAAKIQCNVHAINTATDISKILAADPTITHVVIEAAFISADNMGVLVYANPNVEFTCRIHSQVAFLTVEAGAIMLIRQYIQLQDSTLNFKLAVNSDRLGTFLEQSYAGEVLFLPNLYWLTNQQNRVWHSPAKTLSIASFGAIRIQKNHIAAASASLMIAAIHKKHLNFYISVSRVEHGKGVVQSIENLFSGVSYATLIQVPWSNWSDFLRIIGNMDLHMQLSTTETFNITTADAANSLVPTVSSSALDWVPRSWIADPDNPSDIARVGWHLLNDPHAGHDGLVALKRYNAMSLGKWMMWLDGQAADTMTDYHLMR